MSITNTTVGKIDFLTWMLYSTTAPEAITLKLFSNDIIPLATHTTANYTEASFTGYAAKTVARANWTTPVAQSDGSVLSSNTTQSYTVGSSQTIYGAFFVGATSGHLLWIERFDTPKNLINGDTYTYTPIFSV